MNYGYIRVSTEEQNLDNQKLAISQQYHVDYWVEEKRSGTLDYKKRSLGDRPQKHGHPSRREVAYYQNMTI